MSNAGESEEFVPKKGLVIFGKDIREIVCFRKAFITGITVGVVGGLITFMITSKPTFSSHMGFTCIWLGVFGYWFPCRYKYESSRLQFEYLKEMHEKNMKKEPPV